MPFQTDSKLNKFSAKTGDLQIIISVVNKCTSEKCKRHQEGIRDAQKIMVSKEVSRYAGNLKKIKTKPISKLK